MPIELNLNNHEEIALPSWIASSSLTLAEIGAVVAIAALTGPNGNDATLEARLQSPEMKPAIVGLKNKGVLTISIEDNTLNMSIDLDPVNPHAQGTTP